MRKTFLFLIMFLLCGMLFGCVPDSSPSEPTNPCPGESTAPTESTQPETTLPPTPVGTLPNGTVLAGVDVSAMTPEEALDAIVQGVENYRLKIVANNRTVHISAADVELSLDTYALTEYLTALSRKQNVSEYSLAQCVPDKAVSAVKDALTVYVRNPSIRYNATENTYYVVPPHSGTRADVSQVDSLVSQAFSCLQPALYINVPTYTVSPDYAEDDPIVQQSLNQANEFVSLHISYQYADTAEYISPEQLAEFLQFEDQYRLGLNTAAIRNYVFKMSDAHSGNTTRRDFITTPGYSVGYTVDYYDAVLDGDAMYESLVNCLKERKSGSHTAPYVSALRNKPYGGNYVEIDLNGQQLWVYKNGEMVVSSPVVSGSVAGGHCTPTGIFAIDDKSTNCYLVGSTWREFVSYWLGFNGPIGMHDATWRGSFGESIYLYNGSHGCVNLPLSKMPTIFENVSLGTKVIVYGGRTSVQAQQQVLSGTNAYTCTAGSAPFSLDVTAKYSGTTLRYESSNPQVATVDNTGLVTPLAPGNAQITIISPKSSGFLEARFTVSVTVNAPEHEHQVDQWYPAPGFIACAGGTQSGQCSICQQTVERTCAPEPHNFSGDAPSCIYGCGTANPNLQPTQPEETQPEITQPQETQPEETQPQETT